MIRSKTCCFTGHRPEKCKGPESSIKSQLAVEIDKTIKDGYDTFISGMALGVDIWAAEEVIKKQQEGQMLKLICVVPFEGFEKNRTKEEIDKYQRIISCADNMVIISPRYKRWCFHARDEWMVDHSSRVIAVFNGTPGGTESTILYAREKAYVADIIIIDDSELD